MAMLPYSIFMHVSKSSLFIALLLNQQFIQEKLHTCYLIVVCTDYGTKFETGPNDYIANHSSDCAYLKQCSCICCVSSATIMEFLDLQCSI